MKLKKRKDRPATLADQIKVIERMVEMYEDSFTDLVGKFKGQIRPGQNRKEWAALKAARETLYKIWHLGDASQNTL